MPSTIMSSPLAVRAASKNLFLNAVGGKVDTIKAATVLGVKKGLNVGEEVGGMDRKKPAVKSFTTVSATRIKVESTVVASSSSLEAMQKVKDLLTQDLKVLLDEFTRFQQNAAMSPEVRMWLLPLSVSADAY